MISIHSAKSDNLLFCINKELSKIRWFINYCKVLNMYKVLIEYYYSNKQYNNIIDTTIDIVNLIIKKKKKFNIDSNHYILSIIFAKYIDSCNNLKKKLDDIVFNFIENNYTNYKYIFYGKIAHNFKIIKNYVKSIEYYNKFLAHTSNKEDILLEIVKIEIIYNEYIKASEIFENLAINYSKNDLTLFNGFYYFKEAILLIIDIYDFNTLNSKIINFIQMFPSFENSKNYNELIKILNTYFDKNKNEMNYIIKYYEFSPFVLEKLQFLTNHL